MLNAHLLRELPGNLLFSVCQFLALTPQFPAFLHSSRLLVQTSSRWAENLEDYILAPLLCLVLGHVWQPF